MNAEQWQLVKEIFGDALEIRPNERASFIINLCGGDDEVRREVEKLLDSFDDEYMQEPAISDVAGQFSDYRLEAGDVIGHYTIDRRLGSGGMGEVYLAEDTILDRFVALKILSHDAVLDPSAGRRLKHEAKAAAALDHPNIGTVYEVGEADGYKFIAMQYLKGETLDERLSRGRIPVREALDIAIQIADALSEAHTHGIVHRDIKPSNVMIDDNGKIKVLDFSLAKRSAIKTTETTESLFSRPGMIVGTVAYMSPEQARGSVIDGRTDIWSFGVLMYEMLTGRNPFSASTTSDTLAAILTLDVPPLERPDIPVALDIIVRKALQKDLAVRYKKIDDLLDDLKSLTLDDLPGANFDYFSSDPDVSFDTTLRQKISTAESPRKVTLEDRLKHTTYRDFKYTSVVWAIAASSILLIAGAAGLYWWRTTWGGEMPSGNGSPSISPMASWKRDLGEDLNSAARFSPDGKLVTFASTRNGISAVWLKQISGGEAFLPKQDQWPEVCPIFSPDGEQIAFLSKRGDEYGIWSMPKLGGPVTFLSKVDEGTKEILKWSEDGHQLFIASRNAVFSLDLETKNTEKLLELPNLPGTSFAIAPEEDRIAYIDVQNGQSDIWVVPISGGKTTRVTDDEFEEGDLVWHPDGNRIIYDSVRNGISQIYVCGLNGGSPEPPFTSNVSLYISDVSPDGKEILYYSQRDDADLWNVRIDNQRETRLTDSVAMEMWARESSDGLKIVYQKARTDDPSLRIVKASIISESLTPEHTTQELTNDGYLPSWSPDGKRIAFLRSSGGQANLWTISSDMGQDSPLTTQGVTFGGLSSFPYNRLQTQDYQWSQDGKAIVYCARRDGISNVWQANSDGSGETRLTDNGMPGPWLFCPVISPSGNRIAFVRLDLRDGRSGINRWSIWLYEAGGTRKIFESSTLLGIVGWSSDGGLIAKSTIAATSETVLPSTVDLLSISTDQRPVRLLNRITDAYSKNIILSPDTELLAYVKRADGIDSIHVVSTRGDEDRTILTSNDGRVYFGGLAWDHEGTSIYFARQANWQEISMMVNSR